MLFDGIWLGVVGGFKCFIFLFIQNHLYVQVINFLAFLLNKY